jgi:trehalose 6-phosphate synthase
MKRLKRRYGLGTQLVGLGVDRIDYTKGIPERFRALDRFFERYPEFQGRVVVVEIGVPSRVHIEAYQRVNDEIDEVIERVNWKYQRGAWKPILYVKEHVSPTTLRAWYRLADFCLVSPLHDGMNLVAKEFVASRADERGVLLLSRFTGAARELTEALLVNPYATDQLAQAIHQAITMSPEEQQRRMRKLRSTVQEQNIYRWAGHVLSNLFQFEFQET